MYVFLKYDFKFFAALTLPVVFTLVGAEVWLQVLRRLDALYCLCPCCCFQ